MALATVEEIFEGVRAELSDLDRYGGEVFTNDRLLPHYRTAYATLINAMRRYQVKAVERTAYLIVPAYTTRVYPSLFGIDDFGEIVEMRERAAPASVTITGATDASPIVLTVDTTNLADNMAVLVSGVQGQSGANGRFFITIPSAGTARLLGSKSGGAYVSGGTLTVDASGEEFEWVAPWNDLPQNEDSRERLERFRYTQEYIEFRGATRDNQVRIVYLSSGAAPSSGTLYIDNIGEALTKLTAHEAASAAAITRGELKARASELAEASNAAVEAFLQDVVRDHQNAPIQPGMYGRRDAHVFVSRARYS